MASDRSIIRKGKRLAFLLRHDKEALRLADHYNEIIGSFRPTMNEAPAEVLDSILYDMVNNR